MSVSRKMMKNQYIMPEYFGNKNLSFTALGILSVMLNDPESDYLTYSELANKVCPNKDETNGEIRKSLEMLLEEKYLIEVSGDKYAVNKFKILDMKMIGA